MHPAEGKRDRPSPSSNLRDLLIRCRLTAIDVNAPPAFTLLRSTALCACPKDLQAFGLFVQRKIFNRRTQRVITGGMFQLTVGNHFFQSTINNQQSTINNQQSSIGNPSSTDH